MSSSGCGRFADRRYADNVGRFADTYNCIKTAFHDTDILTDILADRENVGEDVGVVECGLYAIVCVGDTSVLQFITDINLSDAASR